MSTDQMTVAAFLSPAEAEIVRARLDEEGIPSIILGDGTEAALPGVTDYERGIRLNVAPENAERARQILALVRQEALADARATGLPLTAAGRPGWICPDCRAVVEIELELCPSCGRLMDLPADQESAAARAIAAGEDVEPPEVKQDLKTWVGDRLANRAFKAAIIGLLAAGSPVLMLYSVLLLLQLRQSKAELSDGGKGQTLVAWLLNAGIFLGGVVVLMAFLINGLVVLGVVLIGGRFLFELAVAGVIWLVTSTGKPTPPAESTT